MLRRGSLSCIITLLSSSEQEFLQVIAGTILFALAAVAHLSFRPFVDDSLNFLEGMAILSHLAVCAVGVILVPSTSRGLLVQLSAGQARARDLNATAARR
jgi:hypothetical protein